MYRLLLLFFFLLPLVAADDDFRFFIDGQVSKIKEIAKETKDVVVVAENKTKVIIVICNGNFEAVRVHSRKRNFGMNFKGMDFFLFDKENGREITFQNPEKFRSFRADGNDIKVQKDTFKVFTAEVTSNAEFLEFIAKKKNPSTVMIFVDLQIFDFREEKEE